MPVSPRLIISCAPAILEQHVVEKVQNAQGLTQDCSCKLRLVAIQRGDVAPEYDVMLRTVSLVGGAGSDGHSMK